MPLEMMSHKSMEAPKDYSSNLILALARTCQIFRSLNPAVNRSPIRRCFSSYMFRRGWPKFYSDLRDELFRTKFSSSRTFSNGLVCYQKTIDISEPAPVEKQVKKDDDISYDNDLRSAYQSLVSCGILQRDRHQEYVVERLQHVHENIQNYQPYHPGAIGKWVLTRAFMVFDVGNEFTVFQGTTCESYLDSAFFNIFFQFPVLS
eukprot:gene133-744_t